MVVIRQLHVYENNSTLTKDGGQRVKLSLPNFIGKILHVLVIDLNLQVVYSF